MDLLPVLRALTLLARLAMASATVVVALKIRHGVPRPLQKAWAITAAVFVMVALTTLVLEGLVVGEWLGGGTQLLSVRTAIYNGAYLLVGIAFALLPALLLILFSRHSWVRAAGTALAVAAVLLGVAALARGGAADWGNMLNASRLLTFLAIGGYLLFCGLYLLGRLRPVDWRLAGIVITETVFELLIPVPEVFFQAAGRQDAGALWDILQVMQLTAACVQLALAWSAYRAVRTGGPAELLRRPFT